MHLCIQILGLLPLWGLLSAYSVFILFLMNHISCFHFHYVCFGGIYFHGSTLLFLFYVQGLLILILNCCFQANDLKWFPKSMRETLRIRRACRKKIQERITAVTGS